MEALFSIYISGFIIAFIINAMMFTSNTKNVTIGMDLSDKVITTAMSFVGALFSWLFVIVFILSFKNSYIEKTFNDYFENL